MALDNPKKRYFTIDNNTKSNEIFSILDAVGSDDEEDINDLMNDSDTEFIVEEEDELYKGKGGASDDHSVLVAEANVHEVEEKVDEPSRKKKRVREKIAEMKWSRKKKSTKVRLKHVSLK